MLGYLECSTTQQACTGVYVQHRGEPELIIIAQLHSFCIWFEPAAPVMSPHCMAQHPTTNTQALCSKFSVASMSMWTSQSSSTVSPSVVYTSTVASCQATTVPSTHCLIMLNLFVPCVCTFIYMYMYLSSVTIFTADKEWLLVSWGLTVVSHACSNILK